jgi:hypothetical protein
MTISQGWVEPSEVEDDVFYMDETDIDDFLLWPSITDAEVHAIEDTRKRSYYVNPVLDSSNPPKLRYMANTEGALLLPDSAVVTIYGEAETRKSYLLQTAVAEHSGIMIQFESHPRGIKKRLVEMNLPQHAHGRYIFPKTKAELLEIVNDLCKVSPTIIGFDSFTPLLALFGGDNNSDISVQEVFTSIFHPLRDAGHCVVYLDHQSKAPKNEGFATGSQNKKSQVDIAFYIVHNKTRDTYEVRVVKDREYIYGEVKLGKKKLYGYLILTSNPQRAKLAPWWSVTEDFSKVVPSKQPAIRERIEASLADGPIGKDDLARAVGGNRAAFGLAVKELCAEGVLVESPGRDLYGTSKKKLISLAASTERSSEDAPDVSL